MNQKRSREHSAGSQLGINLQCGREIEFEVNMNHIPIHAYRISFLFKAKMKNENKLNRYTANEVLCTLEIRTVRAQFGGNVSSICILFT